VVHQGRFRLEVVVQQLESLVVEFVALAVEGVLQDAVGEELCGRHPVRAVVGAE
jgi:hypothetical protein